jgi:hypothetical protein
MKLRSSLFGSVILLSLACSPAEQDTFTPIENGFGYARHVKGFTDRSLSTDLRYKKSSGEIIIVWPHLAILWGNNVVVKSNTAVLVGGMAEVYPDGAERFSQRLIAFEAPAGPALDITDQVLREWCSTSGIEATNIIKDPFASITKTNDSLAIDLVYLERGNGTTKGHGTNALVSWGSVAAIIKDVRQTGKLRKEKASGVEYRQKN